MTTDLLKLLDRELNTCISEIDAFPAEDLLWEVPPGITNSAGNLALHIAGNLQHYVGHVLGETTYARDRDAEFGAKGLSRGTVIKELEAARSVLSSVLPGLSPAVLDAPYPEMPGATRLTARRFLMHLTTHAAFHVGQIGYLRRILTGENRSVGGVAIRVLAD